MNYTPEQIAAAQALLASLPPTKKEPQVWWGGLDSDGDVMGSTIASSRSAAESKISRRPHWVGPFTLVRIEEVIA